LHSRYEELLSELNFISDSFKLSHIYIFKSEHGYNVVCLSKRTLEEIYDIKKYCHLSDKTHNDIGFKRKGWVLRLGLDKDLIAIISCYADNDLSNAHRILLNSLYGLSIVKVEGFDNDTNVLFEKYVQKRLVDGK
jgi:hypothetical protein